jgi:hypothetical protein
MSPAVPFPVSRFRTRFASPRSRLLVGAFVIALVGLLALPGPSRAQTYRSTLMTYADDNPPGDLLPEPAFPVWGPEYYQDIYGPIDLNNHGVVAFRGFIGGSFYPGTFTDDGPGGRVVAAMFLTGPPDLGGDYDGGGYISPSALNDSGYVSFYADVMTITGATRAILLDDGGPGLTIATNVQTAPSTGGGLLDISSARSSLNNAGQVAFASTVRSGSATDGLFLYESGSVAAVLLQGAAAPGTGGGAYASFGQPWLNDPGEMAFLATVSGGSATQGVFLASGGGSTAVALEGETAPGTGGGTYVGFDNISVSNGGTVAYHATISGGTAGEGLYINAGGVPMALALAGEEAPGTGGGVFSQFDGLSLNDEGAAAFKATITGGANGQGIFVFDPETMRIVDLVLDGESTPESGGATITGVAAPSINNLGQVAFLAFFSDGGDRLYLASPVPEPGTLALLGTAIAGLVLRRRAAPSPRG